MAQTHFGYQTVDDADKARRVRGVFDSVASRYDIMNDVLSMGLHRAWKAYAVAVAAVQPRFSDGHDTGIFSWYYLYKLGRDQADMWQRSEERLAAAGMSRDAAMVAAAEAGGACKNH